MTQSPSRRVEGIRYFDFDSAATAPPSGLSARDRRTRVRQNRGPGSQARSRECRAFDPRSWSLSRRRSRRLANSTTRGRLRGGPDDVRSAGRDPHLHLHAEMVRRKSDKGAVKRDRVARIGHDRNGDNAGVADAAVGGIEIHPAGAWQIDLRPGMHRPSSRAARRVLRIVQRDCEIPRCKPRGETKRARRVDHQHGEVAATPMAEPERLHWRLDSFRFPPPVEQAVMDVLRQPCEKLESANRPDWGQELPSPAANLVHRIELMAFDILAEVPQLTDTIIDGEGPSDMFEIEGGVTGRMLEAHGTLEAQLL